MAWDFTTDSEIQLDMAKYLKDKVDELDTKFADLFTQIGPGNLGQHWVGTDYDSFNTGCEGYKVALQDMTDTVRMYATHFEKVADGTDTLATECINIIKEMTTRGAALPGSGGSGTSGGGSSNGGGNSSGGGNTSGGGNSSSGGNSSGVCTSYEDAAAAGYSNIRTPHEFARGGDDKEKYGTYENYLIAMQERYTGKHSAHDPANGGSGSSSNGGNSSRGGSSTGGAMTQVEKDKLAEYERYTNIKGDGWVETAVVKLERDVTLDQYASVEDKRECLKEAVGSNKTLFWLNGIPKDSVDSMSDSEVNKMFSMVLDNSDIDIPDSMVATAINNKYEAQAAQAERERQNEIDAYGELFGDDERGREIYEQTN